jgi:hypothetical protein
VQQRIPREVAHAAMHFAESVRGAPSHTHRPYQSARTGLPLSPEDW